MNENCVQLSAGEQRVINELRDIAMKNGGKRPFVVLVQVVPPGIYQVYEGVPKGTVQSGNAPSNPK